MVEHKSIDWSDERGARWLIDMDRFEDMLRPMGEALLDLAALRPGQNIADIGCGGGWTSRQAAKLVGPQGHVCGIDISPVLIQEAEIRARAEQLDNISFLTADATSASSPHAPFDTIISRLGIMFFENPPQAFEHLHSLMRPGGRVCFAVWASPQENGWMSGARAIVARHIDLPDIDPFAPGPFALADRNLQNRLLDTAGFANIAVTQWNGPVSPGGIGNTAEQSARFAMEAFAFAEDIEEAAPAAKEAIFSELVDFYSLYVTARGVEAPGKAWLISATA